MTSRLLVLYVFHQYNERVQHFLDHCIFEDDNTDFLLICNDKHEKISLSKKNATIIYRHNVGYDFGGWSDALLSGDLYKQYTYFLFVNSSVMGPFLPNGFKGKWTDVYINGLQGDVKLFGSTINTMGEPRTKAHVQSYIFCMDIGTLEYLIDSKIFSATQYTKTMAETIFQKEILMSRKIIDNQWNIGSLMSHYKNVDFTFRDKAPDQYSISWLPDPCYKQYQSKIWRNNELVFLKGNRDLSIPGYEISMAAAKHRNVTMILLWCTALLFMVLLLISSHKKTMCLSLMVTLLLAISVLLVGGP